MMFCSSCHVLVLFLFFFSILFFFFWLLTLHAVLNNEASFSIKTCKECPCHTMTEVKSFDRKLQMAQCEREKKKPSRYGIWQDVHLRLMLLSCESFINSKAFQNPSDKLAHQGGLNIVLFLLVPTTLRLESYKVFKSRQPRMIITNHNHNNASARRVVLLGISLNALTHEVKFRWLTIQKYGVGVLW